MFEQFYLCSFAIRENVGKNKETTQIIYTVMKKYILPILFIQMFLCISCISGKYDVIFSESESLLETILTVLYQYWALSFIRKN